MDKNYRLSRNITPISYYLKIQPNMADFTFTGSEIINLTISKSTKQLVLHAVDLNIHSARIVSGSLSQELKVSYQPKDETVTLLLPKSISGKIRIYLEFTGVIGEHLRGFYKSKYTHKQQEKFLATTQFEATDARRAFPCFDEPSHKAKFTLEVIVPNKLSVVSNTVEEKVLPHKPGYKVVRFSPTPKMSSYLLAFIIGELEHISVKSKRGVKIRIHTTPGKKNQAKFAADFTKQALDYLENYFGIPYPLPVLDLLAIPDFAAGAMENWGAITFRETLLLVDNQHSSISQKQRVAEVIAHELVHQWFGNLVTMEWWTHLWLNESFATYMAYNTVDAIYPEWNFWTKFVLEEQSFALQQDSLHATHPIEVPVKHPDEIAEIFDAISYAKGASVLRMLSNYVGSEHFRVGLSHYLKKHSYKNTSSVHLWEAFEKISGKPIRKLMKAWTTESGFPMIKASLLNNKLILQQSEFKQLDNGVARTKLWPIPLRLQTGENQVSESVLVTKKQHVLETPDFSKYFNLDYDDSTLTIIAYDMPLLARLLPLLRSKQLNILDRLALVRDGFLLAKNGTWPTEVYLEILNHLDQEDSYVVWAETAKNLAQLKKSFYGTKSVELLQSFQQKLFSQILKRSNIGFLPKPKESNQQALLRGLAFLEAGLTDYKLAIQHAKQLFVQSKKRKSVDPNLKTAMYALMAKNGSKKDFAELLHLYKSTQIPAQQQQLLQGLILGVTEKDAQQLLDFTYSDAVRDQDRIFAIALCLSNPVSKSLAWQYLVQNWATIEKKFAGSKLIGQILSGANSFNSNQELRNFNEFLRGKKLPSAKQAIAQTREKIKINIKWQKRDSAEVYRWLKSQ